MFSAQFRQLPILQILCGAFLISFSGIFVKLADVSPTASGFYRVLFGAFFLFVATLVAKEFRILSLREWLLLIFCGFVFALDLFFWHESIMYIGPGLATLLGNFQVFFLAAAGILFWGEKSRRRFFIALPLAIVGLLLIVGHNWNEMGSSYQTGISFGLLTALCYTGFLLSLRTIRTKDAHSLFFTLLVVSAACAFFLSLKMLHGGDSFIIPNVKSISALLGLGLFSQTIGWVLIAHALPKMRASHAGLILLLQPSLAFIWDVLLFARPTSTTNWIGLAITLAAIYMGLTGKATTTTP